MGKPSREDHPEVSAQPPDLSFVPANFKSSIEEPEKALLRACEDHVKNLKSRILPFFDHIAVRYEDRDDMGGAFVPAVCIAPLSDKRTKDDAAVDESQSGPGSLYLLESGKLLEATEMSTGGGPKGLLFRQGSDDDRWMECDYGILIERLRLVYEDARTNRREIVRLINLRTEGVMKLTRELPPRASSCDSGDCGECEKCTTLT